MSTLLVVILIVTAVAVLAIAYERGVVSVDEPEQSSGKTTVSSSDGQQNGADENDGVVDDNQTPLVNTVSPGEVDIDEPEDLKVKSLEEAVLSNINDRRSEHGVPKVERHMYLTDAAREHTSDMAANGFVGHEGSGGSTLQQRYSNAGYDCRLDIGGEKYATGGETIARQAAIGDEHAIADAIVTGWMDSVEHKETILRNYWRKAGVGIAIISQDERVQVYATANFC